MSAPARLSQPIETQIAHCAGRAVRITSVRRLASLVMGILASTQCGLRQVARELPAMGLGAAQEASPARRLRRTVADARVAAGAGDGALVGAVVDWPPTEPVVLVLDESTTPGGRPVVRLSLASRGSCLPLAWTVWAQQTKRPRGPSWRQLEGVRGLLLADRADDVPPVLDRLSALGWDGIIRVKARAKMVWRGADGTEQPLRALVGAALARPGDRGRMVGETFKKAGGTSGWWGNGATAMPSRWWC